MEVDEHGTPDGPGAVAIYVQPVGTAHRAIRDIALAPHTPRRNAHGSNQGSPHTVKGALPAACPTLERQLASCRRGRS